MPRTTNASECVGFREARARDRHVLIWRVFASFFCTRETAGSHHRENQSTVLTYVEKTGDKRSGVNKWLLQHGILIVTYIAALREVHLGSFFQEFDKGGEHWRVC